VSAASREQSRCPDCGAAFGEAHAGGCDVERCTVCGLQRLRCIEQTGGCEGHDPEVAAWAGEWPGVAECQMRGWYARMVPGRGWVPCRRDEEGAEPDLNRLAYFHAHGRDGLYAERGAE
jgi:hypothetical protein